MRRLSGAMVLVAAMSVGGGARAAEFQLPAEDIFLPSGPGSELAQANCVACHSADYMATQPRDLASKPAFWTAEVTKMQKAYGAPIHDEDIKPIVAYLVATYGKSGM